MMPSKSISFEPGQTYKQMVAQGLMFMSDQGMTHTEIGRVLGLKGNVISMHMYADNPVTAFPTDRLPALATALHLKPRQCLKLARRRTVDHPNNATAMNTETFDWLIKNTAYGLKEKAGTHVH